MRYLFSILFLLPFTAFAQQVIKNADFENWHVLPNTAGVLDPDHWTTNKTNDTDDIGPVLIFRSSDRVSGDYSVVLQPYRAPVYSPNYTHETRLRYQDTTTFLPKKLKGYYKLIADSCVKSASISLGIHNDTVGSIPGNNVAGGGMHFTPVSQWTAFETEFVPVGPHPPRYIYIRISIETMDTSANPVGRLFIDSLSVDFGTTNIQGAQPPVKSLVYPNPVDDVLHIEFEPRNTAGVILVHDISGRQVLTHKLTPGSSKADINVRKLASGNYTYEIISGDETQTIRGRFVKE